MDNNTYKNIADEKIASFDNTYTSNHIRMLKILLQYLPVNYRRHLIIYIKFMELQHAFSTMPHFSYPIAVPGEETPDYSSIIQQLLPFCSPNEKQQFENISNLLNSFEQMKNMMDMFEMMKDMTDMFGDGEGGLNPEMLAGMMGGMEGFDFGKMFENN